jgi:hypothetical protein
VQRTTNEQLLVDVNGGKTLTQTLPLINHPDLIPGTKKVYMKISGWFLYIKYLHVLHDLLFLSSLCHIDFQYQHIFVLY